MVLKVGGLRPVLISLFPLLDVALIPLIEDLFKELAMIESCNKVKCLRQYKPLLRYLNTWN